MSINNPLTSNINALTEFANSVTGESDTNLSDAVHTLADGYGQGTSWTKIAETEHSFQITGTSTSNVFTWHTGQSNIWTSNKIIYIRIRDKAGPRIGYFYGSDTFFICRYPINNNSSSRTDFDNNETSVTFIDFDYEGYVINTTPKYGLYVKQLSKTGEIYFYSPDTAQHSIINGTYTIELYTLEPTASIFEDIATLNYLDAQYVSNETIFTTTLIESLKPNLIVTAHYSDGTTQILPSSEYEIITYGNQYFQDEGEQQILIYYAASHRQANTYVTVHNNYSFNALTNVTWESSTAIDSNGDYLSSSNSYLSSQFEVQNCIYTLKSTDTSISSIELHIWHITSASSNGDFETEYIGYFKTTSNTDALYQMTKTQLHSLDYRYRVVVKTSNSFDPSTITLLPVDNHATAVPYFYITLSDYVDNIGATNNGAIINNHINGELDITDIFEEQGIPISNYGPYIHRIDPFFARVKGINVAGGAGVNNDSINIKDEFVIGHVPWQGKLYLQFCVDGITTLQDLKDYITENGMMIEYNYDPLEGMQE